MTTGVRPFSNGTEFMIWQEHNCCRCTKMAPGDASLDEITCPIERAIVEAACGDGTVPQGIADRWASADEWGYFAPPCSEIEVTP